MQFYPEDWQIMTMTLSKCSQNVLILKNAYKIMYRQHYTPARLARFIPAKLFPRMLTGGNDDTYLVVLPEGVQVWVGVYALRCFISTSN